MANKLSTPQILTDEVSELGGLGLSIMASGGVS